MKAPSPASLGRLQSRPLGRGLDSENRALESRAHYADVVLRSFHEQRLIDVCGNPGGAAPSASSRRNSRSRPHSGGKLRLVSSLLDCRILH
jgi:hypothetical protein